MEWLKSQDASQDLLAVLHPPYSLVLWNAVTGTKLWKKSYTEVLQTFTFDPFDTSKLACRYMYCNKIRMKKWTKNIEFAFTIHTGDCYWLPGYLKIG